MNDDPKPVYRTTAAPPTDLPLSAILCITFACYLALLGIFFMLKQILQQRGMCHECFQICQGKQTEGPGLQCCDCCISLGDNYPCTPLTNLMKSTHARKKFSVLDMICCTRCCSGTGNAEICSYTTWRCDQYCHYLRCCGCIIRFNEPYTLWSLDAELFHNLDVDNTKYKRIKPNKNFGEESKRTMLGKLSKRFNKDHYDMKMMRKSPIASHKPNSETFNAAYGPGFGRKSAPFELNPKEGVLGTKSGIPHVVLDPRFGAGYMGPDYVGSGYVGTPSGSTHDQHTDPMFGHYMPVMCQPTHLEGDRFIGSGHNLQYTAPQMSFNGSRFTPSSAFMPGYDDTRAARFLNRSIPLKYKNRFYRDMTGRNIELRESSNEQLNDVGDI